MIDKMNRKQLATVLDTSIEHDRKLIEDIENYMEKNGIRSMAAFLVLAAKEILKKGGKDEGR